MTPALLACVALTFQKPSKDGSDEYFAKGEIHTLRLSLSEEAQAALRESPREYVPFELWVDGKRFASGGGLKLKGAAGSFQSWDERPALTLKLDKFDGKELFHGLEKFHLNNSVQDESFLCEWLGSELFRGQNYPAARVQHALVELNDRKMGLYVLKEGFDKRFLARWFEKTDGNLYDGGFCQDLDAELELDSGKGPQDRSDLALIAQACHNPDLVQRWSALEPLVDLPRLTRFMALELMLCHWDGYTTNSNNYRLYFMPGGKAVFLPHGMDQLFGDPWGTVLDMPAPLVSSSVMKKPEWRKLYRRELKELLPSFDQRTLLRKVDPVQDRIQDALRRHDKELAQAQADRFRELFERVGERHRHLSEEVKAPEPKPLQFKPGIAVKLRNWRPHSEVEDASIEEVSQDRAQWMVVRTGASGRCIAGWRRGVLLERGKYKFEALVKTEKVEVLGEEDAPAKGAAVRISGETASRELLGNATKILSFEFEVAEEARDVELVIELRASRGEAQVRMDSIQLTRLLGG